jgi:hypothetical protein
MCSKMSVLEKSIAAKPNKILIGIIQSIVNVKGGTIGIE